MPGLVRSQISKKDNIDFIKANDEEIGQKVEDSIEPVKTDLARSRLKTRKVAPKLTGGRRRRRRKAPTQLGPKKRKIVKKRKPIKKSKKRITRKRKTRK